MAAIDARSLQVPDAPGGRFGMLLIGTPFFASE
jgi:hypothetical protein